MDNGNTAWLIYPDREVGLAKAPSGTRYSNGVAVFEVNGNEASLTDGAKISYSGCKVAGK
jgi:membrane-bound inhibitor of C-type lysozyme